MEDELRIWRRSLSSGYGNGALGGLLADAGEAESLLLILKGSTLGDSSGLFEELLRNNSSSG